MVVMATCNPVTKFKTNLKQYHFCFFSLHLAKIINELLNNITFLASNMSLARKLPCWLGAWCWGKERLTSHEDFCWAMRKFWHTLLPGFHFSSTIPRFWRIVFLSAKVLVGQASDSLPNVGELSRKVYPLPSDLEYEWRRHDMNHMLS